MITERDPGLAPAVEVFADVVSRAPLEVSVVISFDVRVNGSGYALTVRAVPPADSFQRLISPTQNQG